MQLTCITMPGYVETIAPLCDRVIQMRSGIYSAMEQARLPMIARGASVFCAPHYNVPVFHKGPLVVTIHDLTHLLFPEYGKKLRAHLYAEPMLRIACAKASRIIVPSHYTREMLVRRLDVDPKKISVIACAVSDAFRPQAKMDAEEKVRVCYGLSAPYIIFVGSPAPHKNLVTLLIAYQRLCARHRDMPELVLVLPQNSSASRADINLLSLLSMPGVRCLHGVTDRSLASLYSAALMTVMPSFEEGFGLPVVESMACGTPVVCSHVASLPEIAGGAAVYFAPDSAEEMTFAIEQLLYSDKLRQRLSVDGLKRAAMYSAGKAASAYASVLSSIISQAG
ncbi:MAG TPA: glycosyltransferase family 1 protein [Silvibacterium sp.]|nr:glycosyltransferase family 1 protein [Silvibacterium sp.]